MWNGAWPDLTVNMDKWWGLVNVVMNLQVPQNSGNLLTSYRPINFSGRTVLQADKSSIVFLTLVPVYQTMQPSIP
jgi:hypothetical protein